MLLSKQPGASHWFRTWDLPDRRPLLHDNNNKTVLTKRCTSEPARIIIGKQFYETWQWNMWTLYPPRCGWQLADVWNDVHTVVRDTELAQQVSHPAKK